MSLVRQPAGFSLLSVLAVFAYRSLRIGVEKWRVQSSGIPHLAKNERDTPNFLHALLDTAECAPFFKERRMKFVEPSTLHRKSGIWGTPRSVEGKKFWIEDRGGKMFLWQAKVLD
jgi:hypothetical protein